MKLQSLFFSLLLLVASTYTPSARAAATASSYSPTQLAALATILVTMGATYSAGYATPWEGNARYSAKELNEGFTEIFAGIKNKNRSEIVEGLADVVTQLKYIYADGIAGHMSTETLPLPVISKDGTVTAQVHRIPARGIVGNIYDRAAVVITALGMGTLLHQTLTNLSTSDVAPVAKAGSFLNNQFATFWKVGTGKVCGRNNC